MNYNTDFKKFTLYEDGFRSTIATDGTIVMNYDEIQLTDEEMKAAILEGKKKKFFHGKNKEYWDRQEVAKKVANLVRDDVKKIFAKYK